MVTKSGSAVTQQLQRPPQHPLQVWVISATWLPSDSPWGPSLRIYQTCPERGKWNIKSVQQSNYSLARAVYKWDEAIAAIVVWHAGPLSWSNWNLEMLVFVERRNPENPEKNPWSKVRTNNKLNPHITLGWNWTQATFVGGEHSHYCTIPVPHDLGPMLLREHWLS